MQLPTSTYLVAERARAKATRGAQAQAPAGGGGGQLTNPFSIPLSTHGTHRLTTYSTHRRENKLTRLRAQHHAHGQSRRHSYLAARRMPSGLADPAAAARRPRPHPSPERQHHRKKGTVFRRPQPPFVHPRRCILPSPNECFCGAFMINSLHHKTKTLIHSALLGKTFLRCVLRRTAILCIDHTKSFEQHANAVVHHKGGVPCGQVS